MNKLPTLFLMFLLLLQPIDAKITIQENNFCKVITEKESGAFKQVIECDYWKNSSNQSQQSSYPSSGGGGGGSNCKEGEYFNLTKGKCIPSNITVIFDLPKDENDEISKGIGKDFIISFLLLVDSILVIIVLVIIGIKIGIKMVKRKKE